MGMICDVCFTDSWQPCPEGTPGAVADREGNLVVCGCCQLVTIIGRLRDAAIPALEWFEQVYPADVFTGISGDEGAVKVVEIRENLRAALANTTL